MVARYGFCRTTIYQWLRHASSRGRGSNALVARTGTERPRILTPVQVRQVFRWINGKNPMQYGFDYELCTTDRARIGGQEIRHQLGSCLGRRAAGSPEGDAAKALGRDPYPTLAAHANRDGAAISDRDESDFRADSVQGKPWAPIGQTPVVNVPGQRQSICAASAVSDKGAFWFATYNGALNGDSFVARLKTLMHRRKKPLLLVLDGLPAHKTKAVNPYAASTQGWLTVHLLPGYAPELNPDELVWHLAKRTGNAHRPLQKGESLESRVAAQLAEIGNNPKLVRSFFSHPSVADSTDL